MIVRSAVCSDGAPLAALLTAYLVEQFPGHIGMSAEQLERDVLSGASAQRVLLAETAGQLIGFTAWHPVFDMHWGKPGAQIADLYVVPSHRGLGIALALVVAVCANSAAQGGGQYLTGGAYNRDSQAGHFYERFAVAFDSAECHCAGAAFRRLASLDGQPLREIARQLPPKDWNYVK